MIVTQLKQLHRPISETDDENIRKICFRKTISYHEAMTEYFRCDNKGNKTLGMWE